MTKKQSLLVFSIGPVQSFIAAARKLEDLWSGSYVLSYLAESGIKRLFHLGDEQGLSVEMVYPAETRETLQDKWHEDHVDIASIPNRFVAIVGGNQIKTAEMARNIAETVKSEMKRLCVEAIALVFPEGVNRERMNQVADEQVEKALELFWATEELSDLQQFESARAQLEKRLAAAKNNRQYSAFCQTGLICTVCSQRDALCDEEFAENETIGQMTAKLRTTWEKRNKSLKQYTRGEPGEGRIKAGEYLCAICLGKRVSREFFRKEKNVDGNTFNRFESTIDLAGKKSYYAVMAMDGDNMGAWFSGEKKLPGVEQSDSQLDSYREVSRRLGFFAKRVVPSAVKKYDGQLIYAGGDDILAMVPLSGVFALAQELRQAFSDPEKGLGEQATASMGIVIAHQKSPLYNTLDWARAMEGVAKQYVHTESKKEKDAFSLAYLARSGEIRYVTLPWVFVTEGGKRSMVSYVQELVQELGRNMSSTFIYSFGRAFMPLLGTNDYSRKLNIFEKDQEKNEGLLRMELERLLARAEKQSDQKIDVSRMADCLTSIHRAVASTLQFIHFMEITRNVGGILYGSRVNAAG